MKRQNSRKKSKEPAKPAKKPAAPKETTRVQAATPGFSVSDLYKASTQRKAEINELMNDIELPDEDESLTVSSMS